MEIDESDLVIDRYSFDNRLEVYAHKCHPSLCYYKTPSQFWALSMMMNIPMPQSQIVMIVEDGKEN
jgi:hypothetical protein